MALRNLSIYLEGLFTQNNSRTPSPTPQKKKKIGKNPKKLKNSEKSKNSKKSEKSEKKIQ